MARRRKATDPTPPPAPQRPVVRTLQVQVEHFPERAFPSLWESLAKGTHHDGRAFGFGISISGGALYLIDYSKDSSHFVETLPLMALLEQWADSYFATTATQFQATPAQAAPNE